MEDYDWCCFEYIFECAINILYMQMLNNNFSGIWYSWLTTWQIKDLVGVHKITLMKLFETPTIS